MRYTGIQPHYFPRLHYFARILNTDIFVIRDDVQFVRKHKYPDGKTGKSYQADSPIKQAAGIHFLTVPITHEGHKALIYTKISYNDNWIENHLKTIQNSYSKAPNFPTLFEEIQMLLHTRFTTIASLNAATTLWGLLKLIGEKTITPKKLSLKFVLDKLKKQNLFRLKNVRLGSQSKALMYKKNANPNEKIIAMIKEVGANEDYCGGTAISAYMDQNLFRKHNITITIQDWTCKKYKQLFDKHDPFIANLSIIDLLMNVPHDEVIRIIKG